MLKIITTLTMFAIGLLAQAQVTETIQLLPFSKIEAGNGIEIIFTQGKEYVMTAKASNASDLKSIVMNCSDNVLSISKNSGAPVKIYVEAPYLTSIVARKAAKIRITDKITTGEMSIELSGAFFHGTIVSENLSLKAASGSICNVYVKTTTFDGEFTGKTKVNLSGTASNSYIRTGQDAFCTARNFISDRISVNASDSSKITVYSGRKLNVEVFDQARVRYIGMPQRINYTADAVAFRRFTDSRLLTQN